MAKVTTKDDRYTSSNAFANYSLRSRGSEDINLRKVGAIDFSTLQKEKKPLHLTRESISNKMDYVA